MTTAPVLGLLPWCPQIGKPLGEIQLAAPTHQQDWKMLKLPQEILKLIFRLTNPKRCMNPHFEGSTYYPSVPQEEPPLPYQIQNLLQTCREAYQTFSPLFKWFDVHTFHERAVGIFQLCTPSQHPPENSGYVIRPDGTFKARHRRAGCNLTPSNSKHVWEDDPEIDFSFEGKWTLTWKTQGSEKWVLCQLECPPNQTLINDYYATAPMCHAPYLILTDPHYQQYQRKEETDDVLGGPSLPWWYPPYDDSEEEPWEDWTLRIDDASLFDIREEPNFLQLPSSRIQMKMSLLDHTIGNRRFTD